MNDSKISLGKKVGPSTTSTEDMKLNSETVSVYGSKQDMIVTKNDKIPWYISFWKREKLLIFIILAVALGLLVGLLINSPIQKLEEPDKSTVVTLIGFPGEILMRMLKMLILPLIVTSLIVGLADLDQKSSGRLGRRAVLYYLLTTIIAVALGIILVVSISPGKSDDESLKGKTTKMKSRTMDTMLDLIRNVFPENIIQACLQQAQTPIKEETTILSKKYFPANESKNYDISTINIYNSTYNMSVTTKTFLVAGKPIYKSGTNILGIVAFSIVVGIVLAQLGQKAKEFVDWVKVLNEVIMQLVNYAMWYSPIGIWSLITSKFASMSNISQTFESLGLYMITVIAGLFIHSFIILPLIYFVATRKNPLPYIKGITQALLTAFGTSSSSATLPVTFRCLEDKNNIDKRVTRFVLPIGATINMDGTALYEAVAAIFIAQSVGYDLSFGQYIAISLTSTLASIGAAGIPQAGLITMLMVLQTVGLPEEGVTLIISVDWFLDRIRTTVNVLGDCIGAGIVAHMSRDDLKKSIVLKAFDDEVASIEDVIRNTNNHDTTLANTNIVIDNTENKEASTTNF